MNGTYLWEAVGPLGTRDFSFTLAFLTLLLYEGTRRHLQFGHWYSENENGVLIQLYAGLITFLLLKLYAAHSDKPEWAALRSDFMRWVRRHLFDIVDQAEINAYMQRISTSANLVKT